MIEYFFDEVESCEQIGEFKDEYVYDLEIDDPTHTFIADDILVHNSLYVSFDEVLKTIKEQPNNIIEFIKDVSNLRLAPYFDKIHTTYAHKWNTENIQHFDMEAISKSGIYLAKKKYVTDVVWKEGGEKGIYFNSGEKISPKGVELAQSSVPIFARNIIKRFLKILFEEGNDIKIDELTLMLKKAKEEFKLQNIEDVSFLKGISDYDKYVLNDRSGIQLEKKCPIHIRAAALHNFLINSNKDLKNRYDLLGSGHKIRFYYIKNPSKDMTVFAFTPGEYPIEIAPQYDYDKMFQKLILDPINRFLVAMNKTEIPKNLVYMKQLF